MTAVGEAREGHPGDHGGDPRVAVVTGAASGIGAATARELMSRGWAVAGLDLHPAPACSLSVQLDMTDPGAVAAAVDSVRAQLGHVGAAVSAAGHYEIVPVSRISEPQWDRMLRVHLGGVVNLSRAVLPAMRARGAGSIVAIASELGIGGGGEESHYAAAKGAVLGFVRSLAAEVAGDGVRVNAVAPGPTDTPLLAEDSPWRAPEYLATLPLRRLVTAPEVARCAAFLVEDGTFCVGETLNPNAGAVI